MYTIEKSEAQTLIKTFYGKGNKRELLKAAPDTYFDVSEGVIKVDFQMDPTLQCQMLITDVIDKGEDCLLLSGKGNLFYVKVV